MSLTPLLRSDFTTWMANYCMYSHMIWLMYYYCINSYKNSSKLELREYFIGIGRKSIRIHWFDPNLSLFLNELQNLYQYLEIYYKSRY